MKVERNKVGGEYVLRIVPEDDVDREILEEIGASGKIYYRVENVAAKFDDHKEITLQKYVGHTVK